MSDEPEFSVHLDFQPLTPKRWADLERLFGERGACGGCWCMWWRIPRAQFQHQKGEQNRRAMHELVEEGRVPGILAYAGGEPVGWCAVEPRSAYPILDRSRTLKRIDDQPVWSITCFFIARPFRNRGLSVELLRAAIRYVREQGGTIVEGYPVATKQAKMPAAFAWTGLTAAFERAGFTTAARPSETRRIMRYVIGE